MVATGGSLDKALAATEGQEHDASGGVEYSPATSAEQHVSSKTLVSMCLQRPKPPQM